MKVEDEIKHDFHEFEASFGRIIRRRLRDHFSQPQDPKHLEVAECNEVSVYFGEDFSTKNG